MLLETQRIDATNNECYLEVLLETQRIDATIRYHELLETQIGIIDAWPRSINSRLIKLLPRIIKYGEAAGRPLPRRGPCLGGRYRDISDEFTNCDLGRMNIHDSF